MGRYSEAVNKRGMVVIRAKTSRIAQKTGNTPLAIFSFIGECLTELKAKRRRECDDEMTDNPTRLRYSDNIALF
jgi:hypothetical protein